MLVQYIVECMKSIITTYNDIRGPTRRQKICNTRQLLICGAYVNVGEFLDTRDIIWVDPILNRMDTQTILPRHEGSCMVYKPRQYQKQKDHQIFGHTTSIKNLKIHHYEYRLNGYTYIHAYMHAYIQDDTKPTQLYNRIQDQRNSKIERSQWLRVEFWIHKITIESKCKI